MDIKTLEQAKTLVKASYINQGQQALNGRRKMVGPAMYHTASSQNKRIGTIDTSIVVLRAYTLGTTLL